MRHGQDEALSRLIIDAITTNETLFFRDQFTVRSAALQSGAGDDRREDANTAHSKRLRIWSAAASTGQEPYSIAMTLSELIPDIHSWDISILGTDICDSAIAQASRGSYSEFEIGRGMDPALLNKYFVRDGAEWRVRGRASRAGEIRASQSAPAVQRSADVRHHLLSQRGDLLRRGRSDAACSIGWPTSSCVRGISSSARRNRCRGSVNRFRPQHHCRAVFYQPNLEPLAMAS